MTVYRILYVYKICLTEKIRLEFEVRKYTQKASRVRLHTRREPSIKLKLKPTYTHRRSYIHLQVVRSWLTGWLCIGVRNSYFSPKRHQCVNVRVCTPHLAQFMLRANFFKCSYKLLWILYRYVFFFKLNLPSFINSESSKVKPSKNKWSIINNWYCGEAQKKCEPTK